MDTINQYVSDLETRLEGFSLQTIDKKPGTRSEGKRTCLNGRQLSAFMSHVPANAGQRRAHGVFKLCFYLHGASLMDIIYLRKDAHMGSYVKIKRHTSEFSVIVPVDDNVTKCMEMFMSEDENSPYLFNFLDGICDEDRQYNKYRAVARSVNRGLGKIADSLGLPEPFTIFVARNTFAYMIRNAGNSIDIITRVLGLSNVSMTRKFLAALPE